MFCTKCGNQINAGTKFCPSCGEVTEQPKVQPQVSIPPPIQSVQYVPAPLIKPEYVPENDGTACMILGILSIFIGGIGIVMAIIAMVLGSPVQRAVREGKLNSSHSAASNTRVGMICSKITIILTIVVVALIILLYLFILFLGLAFSHR